MQPIFDTERDECHSLEKEMLVLCDYMCGFPTVEYEVSCGTVYVRIEFLSRDDATWIGKSRSSKKIALECAVEHLRSMKK